jgi:hypothetical protein
MEELKKMQDKLKSDKEEVREQLVQMKSLRENII